MATFYGKTKRFLLNEVFHTAKGDIKFLKYIETKENQPKVEYLNLKTGEVEVDYYGIVYYKVIKQHKKLGIPAPESVKYEYPIEFTRDLKFGVEMELLVPDLVNIRRHLKEAGINIVIPDSTHEVVNGWKLVRDSSIRESRGYTGYELVSPPSSDFKELEIICKILKEHGVKTNKSCGLHVHHDIHELKRQQIIRIYEFYNKYERLIDLMHHQSRDCNHFCQSIGLIINIVRDCETKEDLLKKIAGKGISTYYASCRYYKINLRSFLYYGTIEFRHAGSSIDFNEIKDWIIFTHKIVERSLQIGNDIEPIENISEFRANPVTGFEDMIDELNLYWLTDTSKNLRKRVEAGQRRRA